jgi:antitoxin component YwqK of YwqJK toxin-antitoxin module
MKNSILLIAILFSGFFNLLIAQNDTIWYDANWNEVDKKIAEFYRAETILKGGLYLQIDYYLSGMKQMEAYSKDEKEPVYEGKVTWYYENGNISQIANYSKNVLNGNREIFYENGKIKNKRTYTNGKLNGSWTTYYNDGQIEEKGNYEENLKEGIWETFYPGGKSKEKGKYIFDKKVDIWTTNYYDGLSENEY